MKLSALDGIANSRRVNRVNNIASSKTANVEKSQNVYDINDYRPKMYSRALTFTGRPDKNFAQTVSITPEYQGILNSIYKNGGLGNVAGEAAVAFADPNYGKMDFRTVAPYYSAGNKAEKGQELKDGFIQVMRPKRDENGNQLQRSYETFDKAQGKTVSVYEPDFEFVKERIDYQLKEGEEFVSHQDIIPTKPLKGQYIALEKTGVTGEIKAVKQDLSGTQKVPYTLFKVKDTGVGVKGKPPVYLVHTPELSQFKAAYGYDGGIFADAVYGDWAKAAKDALPKLNDEKFGDFNPANIWLHDRQAFPVMSEIADASSKGDAYWNGIRAHASYHNPTRAYQGSYESPIDFMRIVGTEEDLKELQKNSQDFKFIQNAIKKMQEAQAKGKTEFKEQLSKDEITRLKEIFEPLYGGFVDEYGDYNMCAIPIQGRLKNPYNFTLGSVSKNFGKKEMRNSNTTEIAEGLTRRLAPMSTVNVTNGSSASSLNLDKIGNFGMGTDFTEEVKMGFTPLTKEIMADKDKLFAAKKANKHWFIDTMSDIFADILSGDKEKRKIALERLFDKGDLEKAEEGFEVLGNFSKYKEGDMLFINWGRPDPQKGYVTALTGLLDFFTDETIPAEEKQKVKYLCLGGPWTSKEDPVTKENVWPEEWGQIKKLMKQISEVDGGRYKDNVIYLNGRFSNRMVACADFAQITSRFEPCGITPLEAFAAGTPVLSHNTGGSPDFCTVLKEGDLVTIENSILTDHAFMTKPESLGLDPKLTGAELDAARVKALGAEDAKCLKRAVEIYTKKPEEYKQMAQNALGAKIGWHENGAFNGGKSAMECYRNNAWHIDSNNNPIVGKERDMGFLQSLKGKIVKREYTNGDTFVGGGIEQAKKFSFTGKHAAILAVAAAAVGAGAWFIKTRNKNKANEGLPEAPKPQTQPVVSSAAQEVRPAESTQTNTQTQPIQPQVQNNATTLKSPAMENYLKQKVS